MSQRNYSIEFLRVVFTLYIVLRHTLAAVGIENDLWLGVEFFFVLSGFLLVITYREEYSVFDFVLRKYFRFAPLVVFGCLLCMFVLSFGPLAFVANILLMSETGGIVPSGAFDPPTWYLSVLLWGGTILFMIIKYLGARWIIISVGVMFGLAYLRKYGYEDMFSENVPDLIIPHRFIRGITEMGLGCIIGKFFQSKASLFMKKESLFCRAFFWLLLAIGLIGPFLSMRKHSGAVTLLLFVYGTLIFWSARGDNALNYPIWHKISRYALAVFTTHYVTTCILLKYNDCLVGRTVWVAVFIAILTSLSMGVFAFHFIELPAQKVIKEFVWAK